MKSVFALLGAMFSLCLLIGCISKLQNTKITEKYKDDGITIVERITETKEESGWPVTKKAVSVEQDAAFFALEVMASAETGGYPMPNIKYFRGNSALDTMPMLDSDKLAANGTNYSESLTIESSYWDDSVAFLKHRRKGAGANIPQTPIKYDIRMGSDTPRSNMLNSIFGR